MNNLEFNRLLRSISGKNGLLDKQKILALSDDIKEDVVFYLVRNREAIVTEFLGPNTDRAWLAACAYTYHASNKHFTFLCTSENKPKA